MGTNDPVWSCLTVVPSTTACFILTNLELLKSVRIEGIRKLSEVVGRGVNQCLINYKPWTGVWRAVGLLYSSTCERQGQMVAAKTGRTSGI